MFRSTQMAKLFPLSLSLMLVIAIGSTGQSQGDKSSSKTQGPTTTRAESVPLVVERGSDARIESHVTLPSDPVVVLLRLLGLPTDQKSGSVKQEQKSTREQPAKTSYEDADPLYFVFCGPSGISAEEFDAVHGYWESSSPSKSAPPQTARVPVTREDSANASYDDGDFIFCGPSGITSDEFEAFQGYLESPPPGKYAPPPARVDATSSARRTSSKPKKVNRQQR